LFKIGNKIEVKIVGIIGEVVELDTDATLVKHEITRDGQSKIIKQWYGNSVCSEVVAVPQA
jgi:hypothetical protein